MRIKSVKSGQGFTIVELLIALSVLSVILVMASVIMIQIGHLYTKGVNSANLQNTSRNITSDLSSVLQFNGSTPSPCNPPPLADPHNQRTCAAGTLTAGVPVPVYSYCINTTRYSYVLDREKGADGSYTPTAQTPHVLWRDTMTNSANCKPLNLFNPTPTDSDSSGDGSDLIPDHMRLTRFKVSETVTETNLHIYKIDTWMAYGDDDLVQVDNPDGHAICKGGTGTEYCGTSGISTTVTKRAE